MEFDVTQEYPKKEIYVQDIADVEYVVLETVDNVLYTNFFSMSDKHILAYNYVESKFSFFDRNGKFICQIGSRGQGPEEYFSTLKATFCEDRQEVYIFSFVDKIQVYDFNGNYKRTMAFESPFFFGGEYDTQSLDGPFNFGDYLLMHSSFSQTTPYFLIHKDTGEITDIPLSLNNIIKTWALKPMGKDIYGSLSSNHQYATPWENNYLLSEASCDTVYLYNLQKGLEPFFVRKPSIHDMDIPIVLSGFMDAGNYRFFSTEKLIFDFENPDNKCVQKYYALDKTDNKYYEMEVLNRDYKSQQIPFSATKLQSSASSLSVQSSRLGVMTIKGDDLQEANEEGKLSGRLKEVADTLTDEPFILMVLKLK